MIHAGQKFIYAGCVYTATSIAGARVSSEIFDAKGDSLLLFSMSENDFARQCEQGLIHIIKLLNKQNSTRI